MASLICWALAMLYQNIMCWWNVFQCSTFLHEQLLTSVVHRPTDACSVIYRSTTKCSIAARQLLTVQLNVNTLLRMHLSPKENYSMFPRQTFWTVLQRMTLYHTFTSCKGMVDSECFLPCLHLKLQPVREQQCNGNVFQLQTLSRTFWHKLFGVRGDRKAVGMICAT